MFTLISIILNISLKIVNKFQTSCTSNEIKFTRTSSIELLGSKYDKSTYPDIVFKENLETIVLEEMNAD